MKKIIYLSLVLIILGCGSEEKHSKSGPITDATEVEKGRGAVSEPSGEDYVEEKTKKEVALDGFEESEMEATDFVADKKVEGEGDEVEHQIDRRGKMTAGEWSDLENWDFFKTVMSGDFSKMLDYWGFQPLKRVSVLVRDKKLKPVINADVELLTKDKTVWKTKTDNKGKAELWIDLFSDISYEQQRKVKIEDYKLVVNKKNKINDIKLFPTVNEITIKSKGKVQENADICLVVDATGSMGDELGFLKRELEDVIKRTQTEFPSVTISTSTVFYRDTEDEYVTRKSEFTKNISKTISFIRKQSADGGGDFPEAVDLALHKAVNELDWNTNAKAKIMFFILDAPPHNNSRVLMKLKKDTEKAAALGIKIIPIVASGIDKETEFLFRFMAISTNGTYVFITDDSGIGDAHLEPTIGEYDVELLNDLMVRLIKENLE